MTEQSEKRKGTSIVETDTGSGAIGMLWTSNLTRGCPLRRRQCGALLLVHPQQ